MFTKEKERCKKFVRNLSDLIIAFIDDMPESTVDLPPPTRDHDNSKPVEYPRGRTKQKPLNLE